MGALLLVLSQALAGAAPAPAPVPVQDSLRIENLSPVEIFTLADGARAAGQLDDAILFYDALMHDDNADIRAEARFRKGMMLADAKRYGEAGTAFRSLLDEQPHAVRARLELARMLAAMGDEAGARRALRQAQATGLPADVAATVGKFDQILRSRKTLGGTFEVALAPDSNVNRATQARVLDTIIAPLTLSDDARARSGLGLHLAAQSYARLTLGDGVALVPRLSGLANLYRASAFNDISGSGLVGLEWRHGGDRITPSAGRTWRWYGGKLYARTDTVAIDWLHGLGRRSQLIAGGSAGRANYRINDLQSGEIYDINVSLERAVSARAGFSLTLSATRQTAVDPGYATRSGGVTILAWREMGRTTTFASFGLRRTVGDAALFFFGDKRREWLTSIRTGATFRGLTIGTFAPFARLGYEANRSSLALYDYRRTAMEVGFTHAF